MKDNNIENKLIIKNALCLENGILKHIHKLDKNSYLCRDSRECLYKITDLKINYCIILNDNINKNEHK